jgi:hypothetical protein
MRFEGLGYLGFDAGLSGCEGETETSSTKGEPHAISTWGYKSGIKLLDATVDERLRFGQPFSRLNLFVFVIRAWQMAVPASLCPACRKRLFTMQTFMDHLADDVLPGLVERLSGKNE